MCTSEFAGRPQLPSLGLAPFPTFFRQGVSGNKRVGTRTQVLHTQALLTGVTAQQGFHSHPQLRTLMTSITKEPINLETCIFSFRGNIFHTPSWFICKLQPSLSVQEIIQPYVIRVFYFLFLKFRWITCYCVSGIVHTLGDNSVAFGGRGVQSRFRSFCSMGLNASFALSFIFFSGMGYRPHRISQKLSGATGCSGSWPAWLPLGSAWQ